MAVMRLDKFLAEAGIGTRSEVKKILKTGAVTLDGAVVRKPETKVDTEKNAVCYQGKQIGYEEYYYLMFHKPAGCVTATEDRDHKTVLDYITHEKKKDLFPVGRLDIDTEGLLLFTNNGELAHRMLSPKKHVDKTYFVRVTGELTEEDRQALEQGVDIGEKNLTLPAKMKIVSSGEESEAELTIHEGKFHQVKRMFAARGKQVIYLKRIAMAGLELDEKLPAGAWRELSESEVEMIERV